jgi:hypothetical protein
MLRFVLLVAPTLIIAGLRLRLTDVSTDYFQENQRKRREPQQQMFRMQLLWSN